MITDLGVLEPDPDDGELELTAVHPGVSVDEAVAATGWPLRVAAGRHADHAAGATGSSTALRSLRTIEESGAAS